MSYQTLAQKYRPQTFEDVVGQEVVTRTLKNSVSQNRVANAYIFCGPRGIGKTSVARILSKTLNCEKQDGKGPCDKCVSCDEIAQGNNIDVLEIDGASNRGIDEIRALRENVKFSPSRGKFKIYIIDEVHMLTQEAFNALLKTLEEPPAHVKFVFATTEPHKVLPTIMSRCQRFDFKKIAPKEILNRIMTIAKKEKIDIDEKAALLIARSADESMRDALVILDQMVSFSEKKILPEDVMELLGMAHRGRIFDLSDAVISNDPGKAAGIVDELITSGKDPVFLANSLIRHYRDLMILKTTGAPTSDMAFTPDEMAKLKEQFEKLSLEEILYILQNLSHCVTLMKGTVFARAPLEITLIRLTRRGSILALPAVLAALEKIKTEIPAPARDASGFAGVDVSPPKRVAVPSAPEKSIIPEADHRRQSPSGETYDNGDDGPESSDITAIQSHWKAVLNYVKKKKMSVFTFLNVAKPVEFSENKVVIGFGKDHTFYKEALEANGNRKFIEEAVSKVTGGSPRVEFTFLEFLGESAEDKTETPERRAKEKEAMKPAIEKAMDVFGGHVVRDTIEGQK